MPETLRPLPGSLLRASVPSLRLLFLLGLSLPGLCGGCFLGFGAGGGDAGFQFGVEVGDAEGGGGFAQALEAVEGALFGGEDVDDEVDVVHEDPLALAAAFDGVGIGVEVALEAELDLVGDGYVLAVVGSVADEEVIGEPALGWIEGEDADVFCFFVFSGGVGGEQKLVAFNRGHETPSGVMVAGCGCGYQRVEAELGARSCFW